jgi:hypothetical protein
MGSVIRRFRLGKHGSVEELAGGAIMPALRISGDLPGAEVHFHLGVPSRAFDVEKMPGGSECRQPATRLRRR